MKSIWFNLILFFIFVGLEWPQIHSVEVIFLFSVLCLIPLSLVLIDKQDRGGEIFLLGDVINAAYPFAAACGMLAFLWDSLAFAVIWFLFTGLVALLGLRRLLERGWKPVGETCIDFGLMYLFISGCWLLAYVGEWNVLGFSGLIVLLTANHFQYSAYFLPIIVGLLNRRMLEWPTTLIVMLSPVTVAVGITYSTTVELVAVFIYYLALVRFGYKIWKTSFEKKLAKWLLRVSVSLLMMTITFSLLYAIGTFRGVVILSIPEMIWIHGLVNAVGVIMLGLIGLRIESLKPSGEFYGKPMSKVKGAWTIGGEFLKKRNLIDGRQYSGVVDDMMEFSSVEFQPALLAPTIRDFYEHTLDYELQAKIIWKKWFVPFAYFYQLISRMVQQIHLGMSREWQRMTGEIVGLSSDSDDRKDVRAWVRRNILGETIFVALYSLHTHRGETYMNIALPLPLVNMTGILKPMNHGDTLMLTSRLRKNGEGDEGIYIRTSFATIRLPLAETFTLKELEKGKLEANHEMWICGLKFLQIEYEINKKVVHK